MASDNSPQTGADPIAAPATPAGFLARNLTTIVMVALVFALGGYLLRGSTNPLEDIFSLFKMAAGLGLVIFIHELGHFAAAKLCDVHVQTFSIGFGPPFLGICSYKWGETTYKIGWIPLGGFVKMVGEGEGEETEEQAEDPRSYKNKKVWQRMIIISAGVTMNILLALICYIVVFTTHGEDRVVGIVGDAAPGGPAWKKDLRPGAYIYRIGERGDPYYDELQREVFRADKVVGVPIVFDNFGPNGVIHRDTTITPLQGDEILIPMLLIHSGSIPVLARKIGDSSGQPFIPGSPADTTPAFQLGDHVLAATDPDDPDKITPLRPNPRPNASGLDYYDLQRRIQRLAGKPITLRVERDGAPGVTEDITMRPGYAKSIGLRMQIGQLVAVREGFEAARKDVRVRDGKTEGDIIEGVEMTGADGKPLKYTVDPKDGEHPLDPVRLPTQMALWAESKPKSYTVKLTLARRDGHAVKPHEITLDWDRNVMPFDTPPTVYGIELPLSISGLGLAYQVRSVVAGVDPKSPAAASSVKRDDIITAVSLKTEFRGKERVEKLDIKEDEWAYVGSAIYDSIQLTEVELTLKDGGKVKLKPEVDESWPLPDRGLVFEQDKRTVIAQSAGEALSMASRRALKESTRIYENLAGVFRGRLSVRAFGGPITIGKRAFDLAGQNTIEFILFLALINVNLAVVNFLPIPVLDGGHMVFLIYEGLRGKPPSDRWRFYLTIMGLIVVLGLMILTLGLDFHRWILPWLKRQVGL